MSTLLKDTLVEKDAAHAVTFVDNHDTQEGQALASAVDAWFIPSAYAVILLRQSGYPCVFYGDYYGVAAKSGASFRKEIDEMLDIRRDRLYGQMHDYFDDPDVVGWTCEGDDAHENSGLAVVMTDKTGGSKTMYVGTKHAGEVWRDALGNVSGEVTIGADGNASFSCADGSVSVWHAGL